MPLRATADEAKPRDLVTWRACVHFFSETNPHAHFLRPERTAILNKLADILETWEKERKRKVDIDVRSRLAGEQPAKKRDTQELARGSTRPPPIGQHPAWEAGLAHARRAEIRRWARQFCSSTTTTTTTHRPSYHTHKNACPPKSRCRCFQSPCHGRRYQVLRPRWTHRRYRRAVQGFQVRTALPWLFSCSSSLFLFPPDLQREGEGP